MSHRIQIVMDTRDAHTLADWWADTLDWVVEPSDPAFIRSMIEQGRATEADTTTHGGQLVWRGAAAICPADQVERPDRLRILFQDVPEAKTVKNRLHWDVRMGDDFATARETLEARGAAYVDTRSQGPFTWHVMTDPEGNEFCVTP
ncbi:VOC family protein [Luteipulveratus halotolerans]|uniref:Glyoxalase-like domain protein n=1 Tax=Luteipulveratus halotolerans TaxID=1631356 RepID=A0A0L6CFE4_9MICO|nr:VOC family protein [Luteipulveratus halotolerans]KNX36253.1 glyoxalase-like domain protein [Luteipulveratus halotolerans]